MLKDDKKIFPRFLTKGTSFLQINSEDDCDDKNTFSFNSENLFCNCKFEKPNGSISEHNQNENNPSKIFFFFNFLV